VIRTLTHLRKHEQKAIDTFIGRLVCVTDVRPDHAWLFGSKSRGDFDDDSDIDLLLVLEKADWQRKERIRMTGSQISLEYGVLLNTHILSRERWEELARHQATLWREIQRDGISLLPNQPTN